ncbi:MAG: 4Fe-4S binding protein [Coriobacteriia bacterium]|nr:4Fe-4S binding protein [Coriobacteriia bacterium]
MNTRRQKLRRFIIAAQFVILPITLNYYSPYLMTSGTAERIATFSLIFWLTVFATGLVVGRSFCGWGCPFNGLQQLWESVGVRPLKRVRFLSAIKYVMWIAWVAAVFGIAISVGGWSRFDPFYMTENGVSVSSAGNLITYFGLVLLTLAPLALGRRGFCRYLCPFGVWAIVAEKIGYALHIPRIALVADSSKCTACGSCTKACPMQLPVTEMAQSGSMRTPECFMCETCADVCPNKTITVGYRRAE